MLYKAKVNFCGAITMSKGEVREIADKAVSQDLLDADYIEPAEKKKTTPKK